MSDSMKKVLLGGYQKSSTDAMMEQLRSELELKQKQNAQQLQQIEQMQNEFHLRLSNYETEIELKNKQMQQLRQQMEQQSAEIQRLQTKQKEPGQSGYTYEEGMNRLNVIYSYAYDSARNMVAEVQERSAELIGTVHQHALNAQEELNRFGTNLSQVREKLFTLAEQIKEQLQALQVQISTLAQSEAAIAGTSEEISLIKDRAIASIKEEIKAFSLKHSDFQKPVAPPAQPAPAPRPVVAPPDTENYSRALAREQEDQKNLMAWQEYQKQAPVDLPPVENGLSYTQSFAQRNEAVRPPVVASMPPVTAPVAPPPAAVPEPAFVAAAPAKSPAEIAAQYSSKKPASVKDLLKKYSNL